MFNVAKLFKLLKKQNMFLPFHIALIIIFTTVFYLYSPYCGNEEDEKNFNNVFETLYYTTIVHFTIGFGDIVPKSKILRMFTMLHVFLTFLLFHI